MVKYSECYKCSDRYVGCHSKCPKYLKFKEDLEKERQLKEASKDGKYLEYKKYSINKMMKKKR